MIKFPNILGNMLIIGQTEYILMDLRDLKNANIRKAVQLIFFIFTIYTWWRFYRFVMHFDRGTPFVPRPQSIDAYLPIGSLVALKNWIVNGYFDRIHPAGLVLFVAIMLTAFFLRRGFCSWVCPIGTFSEWLADTGKRLFGRNFVIGGKADIALRSIKYLILLFFLNAILVGMDRYAVSAFLMSPYWAVADAKLLDFWLEPGRLTIIVTLILVVASLFIKHFWCRYLCPYGALLGILSVFSPAGISRDAERCNACRLCDRACPSHIGVSSRESITSEECIACFECVNACPKNALSMRIFRTVTPLQYLILLMAILFGAVIIAKLTGHWESALSYEDYAKLIPLRDHFSH
jgi:polyferredoxin